MSHHGWNVLEGGSVLYKDLEREACAIFSFSVFSCCKHIFTSIKHLVLYLADKMLKASRKKVISNEQRILALVQPSAHLVLSPAAETSCKTTAGSLCAVHNNRLVSPLKIKLPELPLNCRQWWGSEKYHLVSIKTSLLLSNYGNAKGMMWNP